MNNLNITNQINIEPQPIQDGIGNDTGSKIGLGVFEVPEPITSKGAVNVNFADRTYGRKEELALVKSQLTTQFNLITSTVQTLIDGNLGSLENLVTQVSDLQTRLTRYQALTDDIINIELVDIKARLTALEP